MAKTSIELVLSTTTRGGEPLAYAAFCVKQRRMLLFGIGVGHAGHEIGDDPRPAEIVIASSECLCPPARHLRAAHIGVEQFRHDALALPHRTHDLFGAIDLFEEVGLEAAYGV